MDAVVFGNVTIDVICYPVNDVPRRESIAFDDALVSPGGCASNTAVGLASLGVPTALVARTGTGDAAALVRRYWHRLGIDTRYVHSVPNLSTGVSVGLVDDDLQPRFIHTSGANAILNVDALDIPQLASGGARSLHVTGFFVLPALNEHLAQRLSQARDLGLHTSLDVVFNVRMDDPQMRAVFWSCLQHLDTFMCNAYEGFRITKESDPKIAACVFRSGGPRIVIIKLGAEGCWVESDYFTGLVPAPAVEVVDTTGAGDAFAAGYIAGVLDGLDVKDACLKGNQAGARIVQKLGAVAAWFENQ